MDGELLTKHLIAAGRGENIVNNNHQRDRSASIKKLVDEVKSLFTDQSGADIFVTKLKERYPRYIRDQLTVMLNCLAKYEQEDSDKALDLCISKKLFSANDFKSILSSCTAAPGIMKKQKLNHLGTPETRLMVNIKPNKSSIDVYQNLFNAK